MIFLFTLLFAFVFIITPASSTTCIHKPMWDVYGHKNKFDWNHTCDDDDKIPFTHSLSPFTLGSKTSQKAMNDPKHFYFTLDYNKNGNDTCWTAADCRMPPMIGVIRKQSNGQVWKPNRKAFSYNAKSEWCCNNKNPFKLISRLPPAVNQIHRMNVVVESTQVLHDGKIMRLNFRAKREKLYYYIDMTCHGTEFGSRNGHSGQYSSRIGSGQYTEVMYRGSHLRTHGPARIAYRKGQRITLQLMSHSKFKQYAAVRNTWYIVGIRDIGEQIGALLKTGIEWMFLGLPNGSIAVALAYLNKAFRIYERYPDAVIKYDTVKIHSGEFYDQVEPALKYMTENNRLFEAFAKDRECMDRLEPRFVKNVNHGNPPEHGCKHSKYGFLDCPNFCSRKCAHVTQVLYEARATIWNTMIHVPQCSECPGLMGTFRLRVSHNDQIDPYIVSKGRLPQCLPYENDRGEIKHTTGLETLAIFEKDYDRDCYTCIETGHCKLTDVFEIPDLFKKIENMGCDSKKIKSFRSRHGTHCKDECDKEIKCIAYTLKNGNQCRLYGECEEKIESSGSTLFVSKKRMTDMKYKYDDKLYI